METDAEIEAKRIEKRIYSEPDADPYESELESVVDVHDYSGLEENPARISQTEVNVISIKIELPGDVRNSKSEQTTMWRD